METSDVLDWQSSKSELRLNPLLPSGERLALQSLWDEMSQTPSHIWLSTSGSTRKSGDSAKLVALSKAAFLVSASAVNSHLQAVPTDVWMLCLPTFHVGGLGILARAHLSGARVVTMPGAWDPHSFVNQLQHHNVSLTALVPTQIFDLVEADLQAPSSVRAIVVGGGALSNSLYGKARQLGWPLLPSFGMSECCSQIATASLQSLESQTYPELQCLSHVELQTDASGRLGIRSRALLSCYAQVQSGVPHRWDPKQDGLFWSEDYCELKGLYLKPLGRSQDFVKISGENINLSELNGTLSRLFPGLASTSVLLALPDERSGARIVFVTESGRPRSEVERAVTQLSQHLLPLARPQDVLFVNALPRSPLGKILRDPSQFKFI